MSIVTIERKVLEKNDAVAARNRERLRERRVFTLNLVSSPGAGKTSILERTIAELEGNPRLGVIEGDVQSDLDARRIARHGVPAVQIVTQGACHLEASLVEEALAALPLDCIELLVVENVGNLVCPAAYDLGEAVKVVVLSTPEGDDKPLKYPAMFRNAQVLLVSKIDLLPHLDCDVKALVANALAVQPRLHVFELSAKTGAGFPAWCAWLREQVERVRGEAGQAG